MTSDIPSEPTRDEIDRLPGATLLEFGASWCGHCQSLEPHVEQIRAEYPGVRFMWVEDGKGRPLGRSFRVKLWPTLVLLKDGVEVARLVRPEPGELRRAMATAFRKDEG
jgi:thioredoxin